MDRGSSYGRVQLGRGSSSRSSTTTDSMMAGFAGNGLSLESRFNATMVSATAEGLGVRYELEGQWSRNGSDFADQTRSRVRRVTAKAWRFAGEMDEIATTFRGMGVPGEFHDAAADIYRRIDRFKDREVTPPLEEVLSSLLGWD